jgi:DNA-binding transcriptional MerR regulator
MDDAAAFTIEQLSAESGLPFTTIRMYQHRGLLPPPERRGRVGYYGSDHRARLKLIAELQDKGYSLAAIKDLLDTWQSGHTLTDVLGVERTAAGVLASAEEIRLRPDELAARFPTSELTPDDMARAYELGIIAFDGDVVVIRSPAFLEVGSELVAMGVPVDEVLDEYEHLRAVTDELAERFASVFERNLWQPFLDAGMPPDQLPRLTDGLTRLGPLAEQIVDATLRQALALVAARFLDQQAKALAESSPKRKTARRKTKP